MFLKKRILKKDKKLQKTKIAFFSAILIFVVLIICSIGVYFFYSNSSYYLNPLSVNKNSPKVKIEDMLKGSNIEIARSTLNADSSIEVDLKSGEKIIFSPKKDLKKQVSSLQLMLSRLTIEGKKLKILDFRYNNPVVSFY